MIHPKSAALKTKGPKIAYAAVYWIMDPLGFRLL